MIQTRGFDVGLMPQAPVINPDAYAIDPSKISAGVLQAFQVAQAMDQIKAERFRQREIEATQAARMAEIQALSDLAVLNAGEAYATRTSKRNAVLSELDLATASNKGKLASMPEESEIAKLRRGFEKKAITADIEDFDWTRDVGKLDKTAGLALKGAQAQNLLAEAKERLAGAGAKPIDPAQKQWLESVGNLAAASGASVDELKKLYASGAKNKDGIPLAMELVDVAERMKKREFFERPFDGISNELKSWLRGAVDDESEAAVGGKPKDGKPRINVDADGNIVGGDIQPSDSKQAAGKKSKDDKSNAAAIAGGAGLAGLALLTSPKAMAALKGLPAAAKGLAGRGAAALAGPVGAAYMGNEALGGLLSDESTGRMTALQALATAATQDDFDTMAKEAKYDELSSQISNVLRSGIDDPKKEQALAALLHERQMVWESLSKPKKSKIPMPPQIVTGFPM